MKFNRFKTRKNKLTRRISDELSKPQPNIQNILIAVDSYEKDNLETIEKLKRVRNYDAKKIQGGLKSCISAHGPITKVLIGSATKRILGSVSETEPKKEELNVTDYFADFSRITEVLAFISISLVLYIIIALMIK